jgi:hypothetical protein
VTKKIEQQDAFLRRKRTPSGETWYDIITRTLDENFLSTAGNDFGSDPGGSEPDQQLPFADEESERS